VKHFFTNSNGYLRGIRIDSVITSGDSTIFYPFHTPRISYATITGPPLEVGSWLGRNVVQLSAWRTVFDNLWQDSTVILTQAAVGDSWIFYKDSSHLYYKATVTSLDTMTFLSTSDSVKTILINAFNDTGLVTSDPQNGLKIVLSKNNGFEQVFDLYTFPYHPPDTVYRRGRDFYMDMALEDISSISGYGAGHSGLTLSNLMFSVVDFINPNNQQLHVWDSGGIIESTWARDYPGMPFGPAPRVFIADTITGKTSSGTSTSYSLSGYHFNCAGLGFPSQPCKMINNAGTYSFDSNSYIILAPNRMPEEDGGAILFYFPNDTSYCTASPKYVLAAGYTWQPSLDFEFEHVVYKLGLGKIQFNHFDADGTAESDYLIYYKMNGIECGSFVPNEVKNVQDESQAVSVFPNPASDELIIKSLDVINSVVVYDMTGRILYDLKYSTNTVQIDVSGLAPGVYMVRINGSEVRRFVKE